MPGARPLLLPGGLLLLAQGEDDSPEGARPFCLASPGHALQHAHCITRAIVTGCINWAGVTGCLGLPRAPNDTGHQPQVLQEEERPHGEAEIPSGPVTRLPPAGAECHGDERRTSGGGDERRMRRVRGADAGRGGWRRTWRYAIRFARSSFFLMPAKTILFP